jgi:hypothetical protein
MNSAYLYRRRTPATREELAALLQEQPGAPAWRLQEQTDALEFEQADAAWLAALPAGLWPQGRVFGPQAEIRWWAEDSRGYEVLVLSENQRELSAEEWQEQRMEVRDEYHVYLWGERKENNEYWIETRIPRPLRHPLDEQEWRREQLPYVVVVAWDYAENGVVRLTRLVRLQSSHESQGGGDG